MAPGASRMFCTRVISRLNSLTQSRASPPIRLPFTSSFSKIAGTPAVTNSSLSTLLGNGNGNSFPCSDSITFSFGSQLRQFSTSKDRELLETLKSEIDHEKDNIDIPEILRKGPPRPFKVDDVRGSGEIILRRSYENEDIAVIMGVQPDEYQEEEQDPDREEGEEGEQGQGPPPLACVVRVVKDGDQPALEFQMTVENDTWYVSSVMYDKIKGDPERLPYGGPDFGTLDDRLQSLFDKYLYQRGCNAELARYMRAALAAKEQREYVQWLEDVTNFISQ